MKQTTTQQHLTPRHLGLKFKLFHYFLNVFDNSTTLVEKKTRMTNHDSRIKRRFAASSTSYVFVSFPFARLCSSNQNKRVKDLIIFCDLIWVVSYKPRRIHSVKLFVAICVEIFGRQQNTQNFAILSCYRLTWKTTWGRVVCDFESVMIFLKQKEQHSWVLSKNYEVA